MKLTCIVVLLCILGVLYYITNTIENISKLKENFINNNIIEHNTNCKDIYAKDGILKDIGKHDDRNWSNVKQMISDYSDYEPKSKTHKKTHKKTDDSDDSDDEYSDNSFNNKMRAMLQDRIYLLTNKLNTDNNNDNKNSLMNEISKLKQQLLGNKNDDKINILTAENKKLKDEKNGLKDEKNALKDEKNALNNNNKKIGDGKYKYKSIKRLENDVVDDYTARQDNVKQVDNIYGNEYDYNRLNNRCPLLDKEATDEMRQLNVACNGGLNNFLGLLPENQVGFTYMNPDYWTVPKKAYNQCPPGLPPSAVFDKGTPLNALDLTKVGNILPNFEYKETGYNVRQENLDSAKRIANDNKDNTGYSFSDFSNKSSGGFAKAFPDKRFKILENYKCNLDSTYLKGIGLDDKSLQLQHDMYYKNYKDTGLSDDVYSEDTCSHTLGTDGICHDS